MYRLDVVFLLVFASQADVTEIAISDSQDPLNKRESLISVSRKVSDAQSSMKKSVNQELGIHKNLKGKLANKTFSQGLQVSMDNLVENLAGKIAEMVLRAWPLQHAVIDNTTLEAYYKPLWKYRKPVTPPPPIMRKASPEEAEFDEKQWKPNFKERYWKDKKEQWEWFAEQAGTDCTLPSKQMAAWPPWKPCKALKAFYKGKGRAYESLREQGRLPGQRNFRWPLPGEPSFPPLHLQGPQGVQGPQGPPGPPGLSGTPQGPQELEKPQGQQGPRHWQLVHHDIMGTPYWLQKPNPPLAPQGPVGTQGPQGDSPSWEYRGQGLQPLHRPQVPQGSQQVPAEP